MTLARVLFPEIQAFFRDKEGQRVCDVGSATGYRAKGTGIAQGGNIFNDAPAQNKLERILLLWFVVYRTKSHSRFYHR